MGTENTFLSCDQLNPFNFKYTTALEAMMENAQHESAPAWYSNPAIL